MTDSSRSVRAGAQLDIAALDVRIAVRALRRSAVFSLTTILTLALGIGTTMIVLAIADAVLVRPLPYRNAERLVVVLENGDGPVAPGNYTDWKASSTSFAGLEAAESWSPTLSEGDPEQIPGLRITPGLLPMLGATPMLGRGLSSEVDGAPELLISHALWQRRFGGDPSAVGRPIRVGNETYTLVGVMPPAFRFAPFWVTNAQVWSPLPLAGKTSRRGSSLRLFGLLAPNVSIARAQRELDVITRRLEEQFPGTNGDIRVVPLRDKAVGKIRPALMMLLGAVAFVLLITCVNVAHMLIARAYVRERELAVRVALGASRSRVLRGALTESLLLCATGATLAFGIAAAALRVIARRGPGDIPQLQLLTLDWRIAAIGGAVCLTMMLIVGLLPAWLASRTARAMVLRQSARGAAAVPGRSRLRQVLIASEIAFAVVLLIGTGLMVRTFSAMRAVDPGFAAQGVITMQVPLAEGAAGTPAARLGYYESLLAAVRTQPSVRSAALINHLPLDGDEWGTQTYGGRTAESPEGKGLRSVFRVVTPGYFPTMRIALEAGRDVDATDDLAHPRVVVVNRRLAATLWPGEDPIGKRLSLSPAGVDREWATVIGVAADTKQSQWTATPDPELYLPYAQTTSYLEGPTRGTGYMTLVARAAGDATSVVAAARRFVHAADPTLPLTHVQALPAVVDRMTARSRFVMLVLIGFAMLALSLAAVGIYGVMSYSVAQRRQEIGIRIALGAPGRTVMLALLRQAATVSTVGIVAGSGCALLLTRFLVAQLYGVRPTDPLSFAGAAFTLGAVALVASSVPIARALRIDPLTAIRSE